LKDVLNYPNPLADQTTFRFDHNRKGQDLLVVIQIFDAQGTLRKRLTHTVTQSSGIVDIPWDGLDESGRRFGQGVYLYQIEVKSQVDGQKGVVQNRLVVIN
ncbi:MAG TPA: hypothetical protein DCM08_10060, partial [Microscillaceae bacterium]|nr:hypothetical protein [Microscillaceae bacterium]